MYVMIHFKLIIETHSFWHNMLNKLYAIKYERNMYYNIRCTKSVVISIAANIVSELLIIYYICQCTFIFGSRPLHKNNLIYILHSCFISVITI